MTTIANQGIAELSKRAIGWHIDVDGNHQVVRRTIEVVDAVDITIHVTEWVEGHHVDPEYHAIRLLPSEARELAMQLARAANPKETDR